MQKALAKPGQKAPAGGITARQAKLARILADPGQAGKTSEEIAKEMGVAPRTVRHWWSLPQVQEEAERLIKQHAGRKLAYAWQCLFDRMTKDTKAIQLYFSLIGEYKQRHEVTGEGGGPVRLAVLAAYSEKQLEQMRQELAEKGSTPENVIDID